MVTQQKTPQNPTKQSSKNDSNNGNSALISPGFKSVAAMAGWDEEALLLASLVVEDTPERDHKGKKRSDTQLKTPSNSRRKRRVQRRSPASTSIPVVVLNLDEEETSSKGGESEKNIESETGRSDTKKLEGTDPEGQKSSAYGSSSMLPCMDRLREELSCAICLEICFEPSTTPCGHSFCKKCLRSAADKCGKRCPKCRQLISNGRSCTINTVLWNTIQLLFPAEVEARKAAGAMNSREMEHQITEEAGQVDNNVRTRRIRPTSIPRSHVSFRSSREMTSQDGDAALALRLQREELMEVYRRSDLARANLRAMASRAINLRRIRSLPM
ncbi:hypothetical protein Ancab_002687 [Ancistrocladus abbreviatus]